MASSDKEAVGFWNGSFGDKKEVPVEDFGDKLAAKFSNYPSDVVFKVVDHFIAQVGSLDKIDKIGVKQFVAFLERFGPFADIMTHCTKNFFDKNGNVQRWYHFQLDREHAKRRMKTTDTFLVRDSSHKNSYVLMYAKAGIGLKEMLVEIRKGVFFVNPDQEHPEKQDTFLKVISDRAAALEPSFSTLFQAYTFEKKEDENSSAFEVYTPPSTVPAAIKYSKWAEDKAVLKEKSDKKISGYVPYYGGAGAGTGGASKDASTPGVAGAGSTAPGGSKYATYDAGAGTGESTNMASAVSAAMLRAGASPTTGTAAAHDAGASGGSKYQTYDPSSGGAGAAAGGGGAAPAAQGHSNYQAYN
jgi:hypothetical protein